MKTEKIKQLKNTAWIVRFIDENGKVYVRFVSVSVVETWETTSITIEDLKELVGETHDDFSIKIWEKDDKKRLYINNYKGQALGWYDFNTNTVGSHYSVMMKKKLRVWFANGIAI